MGLKDCQKVEINMFLGILLHLKLLSVSCLEFCFVKNIIVVHFFLHYK